VIFGNKKIFSETAFASHLRSPDTDFRSNRLRPIRGDLAQRMQRISKHRERSMIKATALR
jgi:hypothetical protein